MATQRQKLRIKREMAKEKPSVWIGKSGVTDELIKEVSSQLEKNQVAKIKILKTALETTRVEELATEIVYKTESNLIEIRGHSLTLQRDRKKS